MGRIAWTCWWSTPRMHAPRRGGPRKRYIESVSAYNKLVRQFPTNRTARYILAVEVRPSFEASAAAAEPPEVQF